MSNSLWPCDLAFIVSWKSPLLWIVFLPYTSCYFLAASVIFVCLWFSQVWPSCVLVWISSSLFSEFVWLLDSVGLHLLPTWESFSHYFFEYVISLTLFLLFIWILMTWMLEFCCNLIGSFGSSSYLYFLATNFSFSICFQHFVTAHQNIFMMTVLKFLSYNSNISVN